MSMNIGEAAKASGVSAKMIRHYQSLGLLPEIPRTEAGYRRLPPPAIHTLRFIRRARDLGFSIEEITTLLSLWRERGRSSRAVKDLALRHIADLEQRIEALSAMRRTLEHLSDACHGNQRPECPILDDLAGGMMGCAATPPLRVPAKGP